MRICYIGKFKQLWDEEYIARSLEAIGVEVYRIDENTRYTQLISEIVTYKPDFVLFAKFNVGNPEIVLHELRKHKIKTVCWVFDLYFGYDREYMVSKRAMFKADLVVTTDGGHDDEFKLRGINHHVVRQGIYKPECYRLTGEKKYDVIFVGSDNPSNQRREMLDKIRYDFDFTWFGRGNTNEVRGEELNKLYAQTKVVVGDSVYSKHYWSNRVVETLGRGGFLIHVEVEGIKNEYPFLVTYQKDDYEDLKKKIQYYLEHDEERERIIASNLDWVYNNYTCEHQCKKLIEICQNQLMK